MSSLLLRRTIPVAARPCVRRHVVSKQSSNSGSWVSFSHQQQFWQRDAGASIGVQIRSLVTSLQNNDQEDKEGKDCHHKRPDFPGRSLVLNAPAVYQNGSLHPLSLSNNNVTRNNAWNTSRGPLMNRYYTSASRFRQPPGSIRSSMCLSQLVAADRAATDMAMRSLITWASKEFTSANNNKSDYMYLFRQNHQHQKQQMAFISVNSNGSRRSGIAKTKIPTPPSGPNQQSMKPEDVMKEINQKSKTVLVPAILSGLKTVLQFIIKLPMNMVYYALHPKEVVEWWNNMKQFIKDEIDHYWVGTKLLWADLKTARNLIKRTLRGSSLTRRERKQLLRTISDLFRLVPFSMFLIIPLMEFALPFALKIFPNLLPSTFQDSLKAEENMKRELQGRIAMAKFFQETLEELASEQKKSASHLKQEIKESGQQDEIDEKVVAEQEASAASFLDFIEKARKGEMIPNDVIVRYAHYFKDDLTLDNMPRMQLLNMCKYMGIPPYGSDAFLRFQLRHRMRTLQEDDQRILWEGIDSLTKMELREACQERGMRSTGLSKDAYKRSLQQWLDLSVKQNVPTSLLIMSRTFFLREEMFEQESDDGTKSIAGLADAISGLDKELVNEVILDVATAQEKMSDPGVRKIKLEVLMKQNELIEQEQAERDEAAAKKKEQADKEKKEQANKDKKEQAGKEMEAEKADETAQAEIIDGSFDKKESVTDGTPEGSSGEPDIPELSTAEKEVKDSSSRSDDDLSTEEMDAISHLVSADPVCKERADLESIKAALQKEKQTEKESEITDAVGDIGEQGSISDKTSPSEDFKVGAGLSESDASDKSLQPTETPDDVFDDVEAPEHEKEDDPVVARLKKRIKSMVDKIEVQLSDVQVKIGDKLHVLDKDMDGILSVEEIAEALQQVLKRKITFEEAMEIAQQMDDNKDGVFTVQELVQWIETNQLVRFVEEGRDADMDRIIAKQSSAAEQEQDSNSVDGTSKTQ